MKKMKKLNKFTYYILLVFIASFINTGCQDVDVENFNDPDLETTLKSSDDYPDILSGAYLSWWDATHKYSPYIVNKQTNKTFKLKPTGDRILQLLLAAQRKSTS